VRRKWRMKKVVELLDLEFYWRRREEREKVVGREEKLAWRGGDHPHVSPDRGKEGRAFWRSSQEWGWASGSRRSHGSRGETSWPASV
jgi:hypothetical protein